MAKERFDVVIVGGGVVGRMRSPVVVDSEDVFGRIDRTVPADRFEQVPPPAGLAALVVRVEAVGESLDDDEPVLDGPVSR